ncbi:MAG: UDP-N-acetylmuramate dehydrogenase [Candidatus Buchananbacteria bacterium]|nr:UDP-N-acetylmuramate dehydrogenase [Candidatus Buchananbacteria bacterium]
MDNILQELKNKIGGAVKENVSLADHTWFKIGGPAKYFFIAKNNDDLVKALKAADELKIDHFILGGGSNILVSDNGYDGLVIKAENKDYKIEGTNVFAESGVLAVDLLEATLKAGLTGWSWAAGLPGTIGGAVRGNAGAYGKGIGDILVSAEVFADGKVKELSNKELKFSYRDSIVKQKGWIVISAKLKLEKGDLKKEQEQVKAYNDRRQQTQPLNYPNAGCVFKNIDLIETPINKEKVMKGLDISEEEFKEATKFNKLPVSYIIDRLDLKGKTIGGAQVSEKHGAFIVNVDHARAEHVIMLMSDIKMHVRNEIGIQLHEEVQLVGF